jgi:hypothetical protein
MSKLTLGYGMHTAAAYAHSAHTCCIINLQSLLPNPCTKSALWANGSPTATWQQSQAVQIVRIPIGINIYCKILAYCGTSEYNKHTAQNQGLGVQILTFDGFNIVLWD